MHASDFHSVQQHAPTAPFSETPIYDELLTALGDPRMAPIPIEPPELDRESSLGYLPSYAA
ncbi:hypothetical protein ACFY2W_18585 [Streptomyces sp. NPDC001262]|uniref:hypothetical protein n=1 Tax=unclassified Streptomyces TaxID=2593676 RepID=UPI00367371F7